MKKYYIQRDLYNNINIIFEIHYKKKILNFGIKSLADQECHFGVCG